MLHDYGNSYWRFWLGARSGLFQARSTVDAEESYFGVIFSGLRFLGVI